MSVLARIAEQRLREAEAAGQLSDLPGSGSPLPPDPLQGLSGDALHEAIVHRAVGVPPPEVDALRRVGELRSALADADPAQRERLRAELSRAELEATLLLERSGRMLVARTLLPG